MKKYKYITIRQVDGELFEDKPVYRIFPNRNVKNIEIAMLSFYKPWKEYVFSSRPECVFNNTCMRDVLDFIENEIPKLQNQQNGKTTD